MGEGERLNEMGFGEKGEREKGRKVEKTATRGGIGKRNVWVRAEREEKGRKEGEGEGLMNHLCSSESPRKAGREWLAVGAGEACPDLHRRHLSLLCHPRRFFLSRFYSDVFLISDAFLFPSLGRLGGAGGRPRAHKQPFR